MGISFALIRIGLPRFAVKTCMSKSNAYKHDKWSSRAEALEKVERGLAESGECHDLAIHNSIIR